MKIIAFLSLGLVGCVSTAWSTAPGPSPGSVYVVGSREASPMVWLCPDDGSGPCEEVTVTAGDE